MVNTASQDLCNRIDRSMVGFIKLMNSVPESVRPRSYRTISNDFDNWDDDSFEDCWDSGPPWSDFN